MTGQGQQVSCIPLWVLEDIKNYLKKSTHNKRSQSISCQTRQGGHVSPLQQRRRLRSEERWCGRPIRLAVVGAPGVGKSALTVRYLTKRFIGEYRSDSDMLYRSVVQISGAAHNIELLDCSSKAISEEVIQWAESFVVVYNVTNPSSLTFAKCTLKTLASQRPEAPTLLAGNKVDLGHQRCVMDTEGKSAALTYEAKFAEVSAAEDCDSVSAAIDTVLKDVKVCRSKASPRYRRLSPTKLISSFMCRYNTGHAATQVILLDKTEQASLCTNGRLL